MQKLTQYLAAAVALVRNHSRAALVVLLLLTAGVSGCVGSCATRGQECGDGSRIISL